MRNRLWFFGNVRANAHRSGRSRTCTRTRTRTARTTGIIEKDESVKVRNANSKKLGATPAHVAGHPAQQAGFLHRLHQELHRLVVHAGQRSMPFARVTAGRPRARALVQAWPRTSPESATILDARSKIMQADLQCTTVQPHPGRSRVLHRSGLPVGRHPAGRRERRIRLRSPSRPRG